MSVNTALLVIDAQESFRQRAYFREDEGLPLYIERQQALIDGARAAGIPVVQVFHVEKTGVFSEASGFVRPLVPLRIEPLSQEAVVGQDNTDLAIKPDAPAGSGVVLPIPKDGAQVYEQVCSACHGLGIAGAPKAGDAAAWGPRIAKGKTVLYDHALHGFTGQAGTMPAKGNRLDIPDAIIEQGVDHMMDLVKH